MLYIENILIISKIRKMIAADLLQAIRNREIYKFWTDIQDVIGNASKWPKGIRKLFWTRNLSHFQMCLVAAFVYVNIIFLERAEKKF